MAIAADSYSPDYGVPPGWVLGERLKAQKLSQAEFARRCGRSVRLISEIVAGRAPIDSETALQFEKVLGVDANIWIRIESSYRLHLAREAEAQSAIASIRWAKSFPVSELVKRGCFARPTSDKDRVSKLLTFFRVESVEAWEARYGSGQVVYRHSPSFNSEGHVLATWLWLGEKASEKQHCTKYDEGRFKEALRRVRTLTREPVEKALPQVIKLSSEAGVALVLVRPLPGMAVSGAARWLSPRKAIIQLSARHKSDDHLWFTFFHEAAHILLHSKEAVFVDGTDDDDMKTEVEANAWASDSLIPSRAWQRFVANSFFDEYNVYAFADEQGIAPGIVVGRLQHLGLLPWGSRLNRLKVRLKWCDE